MLPVWSRDGRRVFFASDRTGNFDVYSRAGDGATMETSGVRRSGRPVAPVLPPDGTRLLVSENFEDLSVLNLARPDRLEPLLHGDSSRLERCPRTETGSPTNRTSRVIGSKSSCAPSPTSAGDGRRSPSKAGAFPCGDAKDSGELFYIDLNGGMMAASVTAVTGSQTRASDETVRWGKTAHRNVGEAL